MQKKIFSLITLLAVIVFPAAYADITTGTKTVSLVTPTGDSLDIGVLEISAAGDSFNIQFSLNENQFGDEFLSMRPFKCIDGPAMYCRLGYPYSKPGTITAESLIDLEYEFLFIVRSENEYGIDPYNGRYFVLREENGMLAGDVHAVDLNILAAPPDDGVQWPITDVDLDPIETENERFSRIEIR